MRETRERSPRSIWLPVVALVAVMWAVELVDIVGPWDLDRYGILSRDTSGLVGIAAAPFLHDGLAHLVRNTVPLLVLGLLVSWRARGYLWPIAITIVAISGMGVWLFERPGTVTIGASGLVFGLLTYLIAAGVRSRRFLDVLVGVVVLVVYGSVLWGVVPIIAGVNVSWLGHLFGAIGGVVAALLFAETPKDDVPILDRRGT